ncbi:IMP dehydrogenase [Shigella flexneri]
MQIIGGNVATAQVHALAEAGCSAGQAGIGPGYYLYDSYRYWRRCFRRSLPLLSTVEAAGRHRYSGYAQMVAYRFSGDIAKAIAAGASAVMVGPCWRVLKNLRVKSNSTGRSYKILPWYGLPGRDVQRFL